MVLGKKLLSYFYFPDLQRVQRVIKSQYHKWFRLQTQNSEGNMAFSIEVKAAIDQGRTGLMAFSTKYNYL